LGLFLSNGLVPNIRAQTWSSNRPHLVALLKMTNRSFDFLVAAVGTTPKSLPESIRQVGNLSAGFCRSWLARDMDDALATSEEAFQLLDHVQNELLRHRDDKSKIGGWASDPFKAALDIQVGSLLSPASPADRVFFDSCARGAGAMPPGTVPGALSLVQALNKLKHRRRSAVNFTAAPSGAHVLYIFTNAGSGQPDAIASLDIQDFCNACKSAVTAM
jgi:hypothetical protein